jgi:outer membrane protein TolC
VKKALPLFLSLCLALPVPSFAQTGSRITLTPEEVAKMILTQSDRAKEVNATADLSRLPYARVLGNYDFALVLETGYEKSKVESSSSALTDTDESYKTTATLQKPFSTGTIVGLELQRSSVRSELLPTAPATTRDEYTQESVGLTLTQNLWRNYFGSADRSEISAAQKTYQASLIGRADELQKLVLEALRAFWKAYVAQETFQEALNSRDRYQKLVEAVRKKASYGYANPGELPQVQAEYEIRVQNVKTTSADYLASVDSLATLLNLPAGTEIRFKAIEDVAQPPTLKPVSLEQLRSIRAAQLRKEAAQKAYDGSLSRNRADFSLVGKVYSSGFDVSASEADNEVMSGSRPKYYVGVKYQYNFGNGTQDEEILNKRLSRDLEQIRFDRTRREIADDLLNHERQVQALYSVAVSAKVQKQLREKTVSELNRTYTQGRTDISILIDALNKYFASEIQYIKSIGDYQIALNEWTALRDELIPDPSVPAPNVQPVMPTEESSGKDMNR